jgi:hypothetical protein
MHPEARILSIGPFAKGPVLVLQARDSQDKFITMHFFQPHSLTRTVHALNNEVIYLHYVDDVSPSARVYQPGLRSQV